jgi:hypothetical protein
MANVANMYFKQTGNPAIIEVINTYGVDGCRDLWTCTDITIYDILNNKKIEVYGDNEEFLELYDYELSKYSDQKIDELEEEEFIRVTTKCTKIVEVFQRHNTGLIKIMYNFANKTFFNNQDFEPLNLTQIMTQDIVVDDMTQLLNDSLIQYIRLCLTEFVFHNNDHHDFLMADMRNGKLQCSISNYEDGGLDKAIEEFNRRLKEGLITIEDPESFAIINYPV